MYYINYFFLYSIFGHILESIIYLFQKGKSGILFLPWTPIYGIGVVIIIFYYNLIKDKIKNKWIKNMCIFLIGFILLSILELIGGTLIEKIFNKVFWSYEELKFNFGNYIALEISLCWGLASVVVVKLLKITDKIIKKIPRFITWILIILIIFDVSLTILNKIIIN